MGNRTKFITPNTKHSTFSKLSIDKQIPNSKLQIQGLLFLGNNHLEMVFKTDCFDFGS